MNVQHSPRKIPAELAEQINAIDRVTKQELQPPTYSEDRRMAISALVTATVNPICEKIKVLHEMLDAIEKQALASAANTQATLNAHVATCQQIDDEVSHMRRVIEDLKANAPQS